MKLFFWIILKVFLILTILIGCETTPNRQEPLPDEPVAKIPQMVVGDTWVYKGYSAQYGKDVFTAKVIDVGEDGSYALEVTTKKADTRQVYNFDANAKQINPPTDKKVLIFPLFVGKKWSDEFEAGAVDGKRYKYKSTYQVRSYGTVTTEAGTFKAFKIHSVIYNINARRRNPMTYWYSPEIKFIVKEKPSWRIGRELISYTLENTPNN